jgi:5-methylcytosine-specific restriction endonuclease McrBC regulatory subunit McrC
VAIFLDQLAEIVRVGFPFAYKNRAVRTSTLSGSLDIGRTIREFDSIGIHHRAVVRQKHRTPNQSLVAIIHAVLDVLDDEKLLASEEAASTDLLIDALPPRTESITRREAIELIEGAEQDQVSKTDIHDLCEAARNILSQTTSLEDLEYAADDVSFTFTDSDALWEKAVHACLYDAAEGVGWRARLHPMRSKKTLLYPDGGPDIDPDVVVYSDASPWIVVDAKDYAARSPDAGGVYQIDSYARHLGVRDAALFYLAAAEEWSESFGDDSVRVRAFGIPADGRRTLHRLRAACLSLVTASMKGTSS